MDDNKSLLDIVKCLNIYYSTFLIVLGTVCNILSIIILSRKTYSGTTFSIYFRFLAVVDLFTLYSGLTRHFIYGVFDYKTRHVNEWFCKIHYWTTTTSPDISAWVLVAVTTERVVSITRPFKVHDMFSHRNVYIILVAISVALFTINIPMLINHGDKIETLPDNTTKVAKCVVNKPETENFMNTTWYWMDLTKFVLLPSFILAVLNVVIIQSVIKSRKRIEKFIQAPSHQANYENASSSFVPANEVSLTITLLVVNVTFIVLNAPISLYLIGAEYWFQPGGKPKQQLVYTCCIMAMYTNNAANFLLYCATGSKFRTEIWKLFKGKPSANRSLMVNSPFTAARSRETVDTVSSSIQVQE